MHPRRSNDMSARFASGSVRTARPYLLSNLKETIRDYFDSIRSAPAPLYDELARILRPGDIVITFNYDLGIERALRAAGKWDIKTGYGFSIDERRKAVAGELTEAPREHELASAFVRRKDRFLCRGLGTSLGPRPVLYFRSDLEYLGYGDFVDPQLLAMHQQRRQLPAMIMPALPKAFYFQTTFGEEWEDFWDSLWQCGGKRGREAEDLVVIGYSLPAADERARAMLLGFREQGGSPDGLLWR